MIFDFTDEEIMTICCLVMNALLDANTEIVQCSKQKFKAVDTKQYERIEAEENRIECKKVELLELWRKIEGMVESTEKSLKEKANENPEDA